MGKQPFATSPRAKSGQSGFFISQGAAEGPQGCVLGRLDTGKRDGTGIRRGIRMGRKVETE